MGKSCCPTKETCAWEESLHGENESYGILPFFFYFFFFFLVKLVKIGREVSDMFSVLHNVEFGYIL